jgi:hypothetical protein
LVKTNVSASLHFSNSLRNLRLHIARFITLVVALQILNGGLFMQDFQYISSSICDENVINSVVEYVSEVVLHKQNAMPEYGNNEHNKDLQPQKHFALKIVEIKTPSLVVDLPVAEAKLNAPFMESYYFQFCKEINPPPPRA